MEAEIRERTDAYFHARHHHPARQLLAARRAPLILSCLQTLFEQSQDGVGLRGEAAGCGRGAIRCRSMSLGEKTMADS